jgi:hypothetical protein
MHYNVLVRGGKAVHTYQRGNISVDRDFARFGAKSYAINKINTVEVREEPAKLGASYVLGFLGIIILLPNMGDFSLTGVLVALGFCAAAYFVWHNARPTYRLFLMTSSSEVQAYESQDRQEITGLRDAVEAAMIGR